MPFVSRKLSVIHLGIEVPSFITREEARQFLQAQARIPQHTWIGMVAELHANKRVDIAIEAFARVAQTFPDTALVVMGEGEERVRLEALAKDTGVSSRVHMLGYIADAARYLRALDIFVLPSHTEALGTVLIEAGYAALPCIASRVGGIPEIIEDGVTGILFPRGDVQALTAALTTLLGLPEECARLGAALQNKAVQQFALNAMVAETMLLYS